MSASQNIHLLDLASSQERLEDVRTLFLEYANSLDVDLCFQNFDEELSNLPGDYSLPGGALILALDNDTAIGCIALRRITAFICEMKRLYVKPASRGSGVGKLLVESILERARILGYRTIRLDTLPQMKIAISMYRKLGFKEIESYRHNPEPEALFLELDIPEYFSHQSKSNSPEKRSESSKPSA